MNTKSLKLTALTALVASLVIPAKAFTFTEIGYTGNWQDGVSIAWSGTENPSAFEHDQWELFANRYVVSQMIIEGIGEIPEPIFGLSFGVSFTEVSGPLEAGMTLGFLVNSGEIFQDFHNLPEGWEAESDLTYDPETGDGSASWNFSFTPPQNQVPDGGWMLGFLMIGVGAVWRYKR